MLSQSAVSIQSGAISVSLPTTNHYVVVKLQTAAGLDWTTLPATIPFTVKVTTSSAQVLDQVTGVQVVPREPSAPEVAFASPVAASSVLATQSVTFTPSAWDLVDGTISSGQILVSSNLQGALGIGQFSTTTLAVGLHYIQGSVKNSAGVTGVGFLPLTIAAPKPVPAISSPTTLTFQYPASVTLGGSASDALGLSYTGNSLTWRSAIDGVLGHGTSVTTTPSIGSHHLTLQATNTYGGTGTADKTFVVLAPAPAVTITSPPVGFWRVVGTSVDLTGTVTMPDSSPISSTNIVWGTLKNGRVATGATTSTTTLLLGRHVLSLAAVSAYATTGSAIVTGTIVAPTAGVYILSPTSGAVFETGLPVILEGLGSNAAQGPYPEAGAVWNSNLQGTLVSGASMFETTALTNGVHTFSYQINDFQGNPTTVTITATVVKRAPRIQILAPEAGSAFNVGSAITLAATGADVILGPLLSEKFRWSENTQLLGTGPTLVMTSFGVGSHTVTLTATGPAGGTAVSTAALTVTTLPVIPAISVGGLVRTTAGAGYNFATVVVNQIPSNRTRNVGTPSSAGQGSYLVHFESTPWTVGPTTVTTYTFEVWKSGLKKDS
ncbi:MAG: hypothetical protein HY303_09945, partial [Candidatus Wallbacteria bacterium]|nr:hypothetical protein [Candidatus Wallbacteria bacterium]